MTKTIKVQEHITATVNTMSDSCFNWINDYLNENGGKEALLSNTITNTKKRIQRLPLFKTNCMTYMQADAFANYYHNS